MVQCFGCIGVELIQLGRITGRGLQLNLIVTGVIDVEVDSPVGIVDMVHHAHQALAINVGIKDAIATEVIDLVHVVGADLVAYADLIPLLSIQCKFTPTNCGVASPWDRLEVATQTVGKGATRVIVVENKHDREADFLDERETLKFHPLQRQAIIVPTHFIAKPPTVPIDASRQLCQTQSWEGQGAGDKRTRQQAGPYGSREHHCSCRVLRISWLVRSTKASNSGSASSCCWKDT